MTAQYPDLLDLAQSILNAFHRSLRRAVDGLDFTQLYWRPTPTSNSIGWLVWHLSRWKDRFSANISGNRQVWLQDGWALCFGVEPERTGSGDTYDQIGAFRIDLPLLLGYAEAAHTQATARIASVKAERWAAPFEYMTGGPAMPAWEALVRAMRDAGEHTGQIAYLSGIVRGGDWLQSQVLH